MPTIFEVCWNEFYEMDKSSKTLIMRNEDMSANKKSIVSSFYFPHSESFLLHTVISTSQKARQSFFWNSISLLRKLT